MSENKGFSSQDELHEDNETEFLAKLKIWHEAAAKNRQIFDYQWYLYINYRKGNHYIQFNKKTNQIVTPPRPKGQVRLTVNKIYSITRAIRNFATSYRPRWSVVADSTTEEIVNNGRKSADLLDRYYDKLDMPRKIKAVTSHVIDLGIGFLQYGWDEEAIGMNGEQGDCDVWYRDPFDVYLDPVGMRTGDIQNCRYIDIAVSRPIQDVLDNPNYDKIDADEVSGDTKQAASQFKQILINNQYAEASVSDKELQTVILHETMYKKRVKVKVPVESTEPTVDVDPELETDPVEPEHTERFESQVWVATWIEGHLLRNEATEFSKYNLIPIASDDNPNEIYGEGYVKNLIPIVKVLNRLESQVVEYNNIVNKGRIIADKGAGVSRITNETGDIIEKNVGFDVREWDPRGLASDVHTQINRMNAYLDDISGVQQAFRGDTPEGVTSGVALESLRSQSANNLQDLKDNIEYALARLGEGILEQYATKVIAARTVKETTKDGKIKHFKVKGQVGVEPEEELDEDTYVIGSNNTVKVTIGSGLAYTHEGRISRLDKMLEQGVIDPQTYLENLEFSDIEGIVKRAKQHKFDGAMMKGIEGGRIDPTTGKPVEPPMPPMPGQPPVDPAAAQGGDDWLKLADDENNAMLAGEEIPSTKGAPKEHTAVHIAYSQAEEAQANDALLEMLYAHIKGEEEQQGIAPPPVPAT